jgi:hypothetical protein
MYIFAKSNHHNLYYSNMAEASMGKDGRSPIMGKLLSTIRFIIKIINEHDALPGT